MKPYGLSYSVTGCTCALCRSRGYRKSNAYSSVLRADKHRARQQRNVTLKTLFLTLQNHS